MNKKNPIRLLCCLLFATLIIGSCTEDEFNALRDDIETLQSKLDAASSEIKLLVLKNMLNDIALNDNIIETVAAQGSGYLITFEEGETLAVSDSLVSNITMDVVNWKSTVEYTDGTVRVFRSIGELTIPEGALELNPNGTAPLSALLTVSTPIPGRIKITVKGKNGVPSDVAKDFEKVQTDHEVPVLGLYASYDNTVEIVLEKSTGLERAKKTITVTTGALPAGLPTSITVDVHQDAKMAPGLTLISYLAKNPSTPFIIDNYGDIRWIFDFTNNLELGNVRYDNGIERLANGNFYFGDQSDNIIYEVDVFGKIITRFVLEGYGFHHNVQEKPDGNLIVSVDKDGTTHLNGKPTIEDVVIELDRKSGAVVNEWDLRQSLDENRQAWGFSTTSATTDWFHNNAVYYDPSDNTIVVSGRSQGVVKLDYDNNVVWILSSHKGWGVNRRGEDLNQFLLAPLDAAGNPIADQAVIDGDINHAEFEWNWFQHASKVMPNGHIMLFDNGDKRNYATAATTAKYSRVVEFKIDQENMTVQQIWTYGKERGVQAWSRIVSDADYISGSDNVLFSPGFQVDNTNGTGAKVIEIDYATKEVVFEARLNATGGVTLHRAERMNIYP